MIFIYRHGEKAPTSNCLSAMGMVRGECIGKIHARDECAFYTIAPVPPYKHIAPIQTASVACTVACKNLTVLPNYIAIPRVHWGRILVVVWYHGEIGTALENIAEKVKTAETRLHSEDRSVSKDQLDAMQQLAARYHVQLEQIKETKILPL